MRSVIRPIQQWILVQTYPFQSILLAAVAAAFYVASVVVVVRGSSLCLSQQRALKRTRKFGSPPTPLVEVRFVAKIATKAQRKAV